MAKRKAIDPVNPPAELDEHIFYGLDLDEDQKKFRDAIWNPDKLAIFCNAKAGCGKTTIAVLTAALLVRYGLYDDIVYVVPHIGDAQGALPGTISEKSAVLFEPLYQALLTGDYDPMHVLNQESLALQQKNGEAFVTAITDTYLRGSNIGGNKRTILIIDEAQNATEPALRKIGTRACDTTKVICIGHDLQCDLHDKNKSGFIRCMNHFGSKQDPRIELCYLKKNYRGFVSTTFDEAW